jgi:cytochrome c
MHFSFFEKFGLSVLICAWLLYGINFLGDTLITVRDFTPAFKVAEASAPADAPAAAPAAVDFATLLATVTPAQGEKVFNKCKACHSIEQGGPNKVGPNMWNVVGGPKAHIQGFAYSAALADMGAKGQTWGYDELNAFLTKPSAYVQGTKMTFAGLKKPEERADVVAYLVSLSPAGAAEAAPAEPATN